MSGMIKRHIDSWLPAGRRWLRVGETTQAGDMLCDWRNPSGPTATGGGWIINIFSHPVHRAINYLEMG